MAPAVSGPLRLTLSEYLLGDFGIEQLDAMRLDVGADEEARFPAGSRAYAHLLLAGTATLELDSGERLTALQPGDFVVMFYGTAHRLQPEGVRRVRRPVMVERWAGGDVPAVRACAEHAALRLLSVRLWLGWAPRSAPVNRALPRVLSLRADQQGTGHALFQDLLLIDHASRGAGAAAYVQSLVQLHLVQVLRRVHDDLRKVIPVQIGAPEMGRMAAAVRKVQTHPERPWTVASLAREVGYSRASFAAKFKAYTGQAPIRFVARTRMANAAALLERQAELPLWDIARRVGYDTQGTFTRAFKQQFGVAPRVYAQRLRARAAPPS